MWFGITNYLMSIFYKSVSDRKIVIWTDEDGLKLFNKMMKENDIPTTTTNTSMDSKEVTDIQT